MTTPSTPADRAAGFLRAVEKLPPHRGLVFRACPAGAEFVRPGQSTVLQAPVSTSRSLRLVRAAGTPAIYAITTSTARDLSAFSAAREEQEVLLLPGTLLHLAGTRDVDGLAVRLVFEVEPGQEPLPEDLPDQVASAVAAALAESGAAEPLEVRDRFVGDLA